MNNECGHIFDRDINGCKNILYVFLNLLQTGVHPIPFVRTNYPRMEVDNPCKSE